MTFTKSLLLTTVIATGFAATAAHAEGAFKLPGTFTASTSLLSEYSFRGISQTRNRPAVQGSLNWAHDSGVYLGAWASSIDFNTPDAGSLEIDLTAGFSKEIANKLTGDVGLVYYGYPGTEDNLNYDYWEVYAGLTYDFDVAKVKGYVNYSPEFSADSGDAQYYTLAAEAPLPYHLTGIARVSRQVVDDNAAFALPDYTDWELGLAFQATDNIKLNVSYVDTNISKTACNDGCEGRVIAGVTASF